MPQYRTLEPVTYVHEGKAVSVAKGRLVELTEAQARPLGGKLELVEVADSVFPTGTPKISPVFVRENPAVSFAPTEAPKPVKKSGK